MATKRKGLGNAKSSSKLKFRPSSLEQNEPKGTKPTAERTSVKDVLFLMIQHICRKILFIDTNLLILFYLGFIFVVSVLVDVLPLPKALTNVMLSKKDNFLNKYFVKVGWGWTLLLAVPFNALTSFVYCCGQRRRILNHLSRLVVATFFWWFWTSVYSYVEFTWGKCSTKDINFQTKPTCLRKGFVWHSVDISGHCFILLYSTFVLIEECRVINCWEGISDLIRDEEHNRTCDEDPTCAPLRNLSNDSFQLLKESYPKLTPYIRILFILITCLVVIWNVMLVTTVLFFHNMLEKLIAALTAVVTYYLTYYLWFSSPKLVPHFPGEGSLFKYKDIKHQTVPVKKRQCSFNNKQPGPKFMGMPLRVPSDERNDNLEDKT